MTIEEKFAILNEHSNRTHDEAIEQMNTHGKVLVVRPTGFGKTRLLIRLAKEYIKKNKKRILYVYPLSIIETEIRGKKEYMKDGLIDKYIDFMSYQLLTLRMNENGDSYWKEFIEDKYSIILLDEVHRAGSDGFLRIYESIRELIKPSGIHMIGVTATPNRMMDTEEQNVTNSIFEDIGVYKFDLYDAFKEGILPEVILACRQYNMEDIGEQLRAVQKQECGKRGLEFDEKVFNIELGKALRDVGGEDTYIYKYIKKAGYDISNPKENYFKFIVFFVNIADMVERGPMVEQWFEDAFNIVGKKDKNLRRDFEVHSHYVASSDTETGELKQLISKKEDRRNLYKQTKKLNNIETDSRKVDLLFTVNMINMGYHVENITGIMMLRGTRSEIIYFQQLGRCLSVTATRSPIVYDMVRNKDMNFWSKRDAKTREEKEIDNGLAEVATALSGEREEDKDYSWLNIFTTGDADEFDEFSARWSNVYNSLKTKVIWLYQDRKAPICAISSDTGKSCVEIVNILLDSRVELRMEDSMFNYIVSEKKDKRLIKYVYSKKAFEIYKDIKSGSLFKSILKLLGNKKGA